MKIGVTTGSSITPDLEEKAKQAAKELSLPFLPREETLKDLSAKYEMDGFLAIDKKGWAFHFHNSCYRFHLGASVLRIIQLKKGNSDRLCRWLPKKDIVRILDCTFGAGGDSTVLAWFLGNRGEVTSLEKDSLLYMIGREGIRSYSYDKDPDITKALRSIHLIHADYHDFLRKALDDSYDVVYFDPMFNHPVKPKVNQIDAFRAAACHDSLDLDILREARRVAREAVIVKERPFSPLFRESIFDIIDSRKGQSTAYGVIRV
jgi:16S rRNA (guanine1516-N2)-methyltransferase